MEGVTIIDSETTIWLADFAACILKIKVVGEMTSYDNSLPTLNFIL